MLQNCIPEESSQCWDQLVKEDLDQLINTLNTTPLNFQTSNNMLQSDCIQDSFEELHQNFIGMYLQCNEKSYNQPLHRNI